MRPGAGETGEWMQRLFLFTNASVSPNFVMDMRILTGVTQPVP